MNDDHRSELPEMIELFAYRQARQDHPEPQLAEHPQAAAVPAPIELINSLLADFDACEDDETDIILN